MDLLVNTTNTLITLAHGDVDYLFEETQTILSAWQGPFNSPKHWLYWDINPNTGERTFGHTNIQPIFQPSQPSSPQQGLMWYNTTNNTMYEYTGIVFVEVIRLFAGSIVSGSISYYPQSSQVGVNQKSKAGFILFDDSGQPVRRATSNKRRFGKFLTTESNFLSHASNAVSIRMELYNDTVTSQDNASAYSVVRRINDRDVILARSDDPLNDGAAGILSEDASVGNATTIITQGVVYESTWNWSEGSGTKLFYDESGILTTAPQTSGIFQQVGVILSTNKILIDIQQPIILE